MGWLSGRRFSCQTSPTPSWPVDPLKVWSAESLADKLSWWLPSKSYFQQEAISMLGFLALMVSCQSRNRQKICLCLWVCLFSPAVYKTYVVKECFAFSAFWGWFVNMVAFVNPMTQRGEGGTLTTLLIQILHNTNWRGNIFIKPHIIERVDFVQIMPCTIIYNPTS